MNESVSGEKERKGGYGLHLRVLFRLLNFDLLID